MSFANSHRQYKSSSMDFGVFGNRINNNPGSANHRRIGSGEALLQPFYGLSKYVKTLFVMYIIVSLLYTIVHFYALLQNNYSPSFVNERTVVGKIVLDGNGNNAQAASNHKATQMWTGKFSLVTEYQSMPFEDLSSNFIYSKMFQYALQPTNVIPYFYRMTSNPSKNDITITTIITAERLEVFNNLVNRYRGPISVALHLDDDDSKLEAIEKLYQLHKSNPYFGQYVDVHLIVDRYDRQFNYWRNVARFFARTDLIVTIDVDFMLCSDLRINFESLGQQYKEMLTSGSAVFVIPAFEFSPKSAEIDVSNYPTNKEELKRYIDKKDALMFHNNWKRGHGPTDYKKWVELDEPYKVTEYNYNYEPYILMKREGHPWCDERFVGYGSNKAACLYEIFLSGAEFWVLPNDFLIHQRHPYPENDRRVERKYNKRLYDAYREEACFRYARMFEGVQNATGIDERICGANLPTFYGL